MLRKPLTMDEYLDARKIVDPFGLYDICLESDGACATLVTSAERARDLRKPPVYIMGGAYGGGPHQGEDLFDAIRWTIWRRTTRPTSPMRCGRAPESARPMSISPRSTTASPTVRSCNWRGSASEARRGLRLFVASGIIRRDGKLPMNTPWRASLGGLYPRFQSCGRSGRAAARRVRLARGRRAEIALTTAGAMTCGSAMILRK